MSVSIPVLLLIGVLIFVGTVVQGSIGFGLGTISTPIIAMFAPQLLPMLVLMLALIISSTTAFQTRESVDWKFFWYCTISRLPGTALGAWAVAELSHRGLAAFIGVAVILAMSLSSLGWTPKYNKKNVAVASVASGFLGTSTALGGPPLALVLKTRPAAAIRGTLSATFVTGCIISMLTLTAAGQFNLEILQVAVMYVPLVILGLVVANRVAKRIDKRGLNRIVVAVSISASVLLLIKAIFNL